MSDNTLTAAQVATLGGDSKVDVIRVASVTLDQTQYTAASAKLSAADAITVADSNITGAQAVALGADAKVDVINATDNVISLTYAQYTALNAAGLSKVHWSDTVAITATLTQDTISSANIAGTMQVEYTLGTQTTTFEFDDVGDDGILNAGDTWTAASAGSVDVLTFNAGDVLDLSAFGLNSGERSGAALFDGDTRTVDDQTFSQVRGNYVNGVFTYNAGGADLLVLWDSNTTGGSVVQSGVVLDNFGGSLTAGLTLLG